MLVSPNLDDLHSLGDYCWYYPYFRLRRTLGKNYNTKPYDPGNFSPLWKRAKLKNAETVTQESFHLFVQSGVDAQRVRLSGYL